LYFHYALDHFADQGCAAGWKVMYPVREVLSLVVCGTIASSDDYDDIVDWGNAHLALLRGFAEFLGIPCAGWLRRTAPTPTCAWTVLPHESRNAGRTSLNVGPSTARRCHRWTS
jgi:hypothetical protein